MKNTFIVIVVVLVAIIVVLWYKKAQDGRDADNLLVSGTDSTTTITTNGGTTTTTTQTTTKEPIVNINGFQKGDSVIVKSGSSMRTLSDPNIIAYQTTTSQKGWTIDRDLFSGRYLNKDGKTYSSGTWAVISKPVVGFGMSFVAGVNSWIKLYQVVHISRITKA
jgi:preprotein translocase subunit YajC